jgi:hypothetical protein
MTTRSKRTDKADRDSSGVAIVVCLHDALERWDNFGTVSS